MTDRELFIQTAKNETRIFERVFLALPEEKATYTPHERSQNAITLANSSLMELGTFPIFMKEGKLDWMNVKKSELDTFKEVANAFTRTLEEVKNIASEMSEANWAEEASMSMGGKNEWKSTKGEMAWSLLLDLIHHRGQLSTYIRPMGGKVPSIYGPSGDSE